MDKHLLLILTRYLLRILARLTFNHRCRSGWHGRAQTNNSHLTALALRRSDLEAGTEARSRACTVDSLVRRPRGAPMAREGCEGCEPPPRRVALRGARRGPPRSRWATAPRRVHPHRHRGDPRAVLGSRRACRSVARLGTTRHNPNLGERLRRPGGRRRERGGGTHTLKDTSRAESRPAQRPGPASGHI